MPSLNEVVNRLARFVKRVFKTSLEVFYEALRHSPNAQGYVAGSISELLLKRHLEEKGFEVLRIREKWEGQKAHHGDFYFRERAGDARDGWFVIEVKGVKSNSEKWHKLYNVDNLISFLIKYSDMIRWIDPSANREEQIRDWLQRELPCFFDEYQDTLYEYEEVISYRPNPQKATAKSRAIERLKGLSREELNELIEKRLLYLNSKIRVLETHFVAGTGVGGRKIATPRKDEFHIVAVDIFLKYHDHLFLFANPNNLESSRSGEDHLQQNYVIGFVFVIDGKEELHISEEWEQDFTTVYRTLSMDTAIAGEDMQVDYRYMREEEDA